MLLTKSVPIEATAILARERSAQLRDVLTDADIAKAQGYLNEPGIGVTRDARLALDAGRVTAMHDPTEGGLATALWDPLPERDGLAQVFESSPDSKGAKQWSAPSLRGRDQPESSPTDGDLADGYR